MQNHADQSKLGANWAPGDIMYKDLDGNKKINNGSNTLDDHGDLKVIGNTTPRYQYGITANMSYKNVYLNVFFQGIGKRDFWPSSQPFWPVATQYYNTQNGLLRTHGLKIIVMHILHVLLHAKQRTNKSRPSICRMLLTVV